MKIQKFPFQPFFELNNDSMQLDREKFEAAQNRENKRDSQEKYYAENEVVTLKNQAYKEGYEQAKAEIEAEKNNQNKRLQEVLSQIEAQLSKIQEKISHVNMHDVQMLANVFSVFAEKFSKILLEKFPHELVEEIIHKSLNLLKAEEKLYIYVNPIIKENIQPSIETIAEKSGYKGEIIIQEDEGVEQFDTVIKWEDGKIESNKRKILEKLESILKTHEIEEAEKS